MKRRSFKDTKQNRNIAAGLGYSFTCCEKRKKIFIKLSNSDNSVIKQLMSE